MANEMLWSVLANRQNADKILDLLPVDELQSLFPPAGLGLKLDETMDGPFIAFYNAVTKEISYFTVLEFVEAVKADFWGIRRKYAAFLAEQKKEAKKNKPVEAKKVDRKNRKKRGIY